MDWVWIVVVAPLIVLSYVLAFEAGGWYYRFKHVEQFGHPGLQNAVTSVKIVPRNRQFFWSSIMTQDVKQGATFAFDVVCKNAQGVVVAPQSAVSVAVDPTSLGTATPTSFVAAADQTGSGTLVATADGVASPAFSINVVADSVVASVEIVPKA
jgi:hypothetical protein